jgi:signal transduction histidine kinase
MFRVAIWFCLICIVQSVFGQGNVSVQVKTFDQQLKPFSNIDISVNGSDFISVGSKGSAFADFPAENLPPKSIKVRNPDFEAESWNYSKGVLEIIVRKKSYKVMKVVIRNSEGKPIPNLDVTFLGRKALQQKTNAAGELELLLPLDERVTAGNQFKVDGYTVAKGLGGDNEYVLTLQEVVKVKEKEESPEPAVQNFKDFDLKNLDSIRSLTVFYAVFKDYPMDNLSAVEKREVDRKFNQLMFQLEDSLRNPRTEYLGRISDSSFVAEDIRNLLAQAEAEKATLDNLRDSFDEKIQVLNEKLSQGVGNLDPETRTKLLTDINKLETILQTNEEKFYRNQSNYQSMLNSLKQKFYDIQDLENKLYLSESQRQEEREQFRRKIYTTLIVTVSFALITIMLVYFSNRLKRQQKELILANAEVKRMNENLEGLVRERTALLENAHREMDIFLYKASHDLRGPICSIIGLCNIASRTVNQESLELVQKTYNTAFAMDRMLKKLKVISEINHPSNFSSVSLEEQFKNIRLEYRKYLRDNRVQFSTQIPAGLSFHSYPNLVDVILTNLIENALYFSTINSERQSVIEVIAVECQETVEITITDNGIGIEEGIQDKIWDMFFIGSEHSHGNGLGLYIVKKSIEALKGSIVLKSRPGVFTQFIVSIPYTPASVPHNRQEKLLLTQT